MKQYPNFSPDGWSANGRIGVIVPHADVGPEAEFGAIAQGSVSIHGARLNFPAMRADGEMDEKIPHAPIESFTKPPYLDQTIESLATAPLNAIALAFTSSAYAHGPMGERALIKRLEPRTRSIPIISTCLSAELALKTIEAKNLALINPSWFDAEIDMKGAEYFTKAGFSVVHHAPCGLPSGQKYVTPQNLYDWVKGVIAKSRPNAVFIGGNGQRAVGVIAAIERDTGVTMLTANQVLFWNALRLSKVAINVDGYGQLFSMTPREDFVVPCL